METRVCKRCGVEYPLSIEYFKRYTQGSHSFEIVCRKCRNRDNMEYRRRVLSENEEMALRWKEYRKNWKRNNMDKIVAQVVRRTRERYHEDEIYRWTLEARRGVRSALNERKAKHFSDKRVVEITGLPKEELKAHLLKTYFDIYGSECSDLSTTHVDHIVPLCTATNLNEVKSLFHYTNLRLLKECDNRRKGTTLDYRIEVDDTCTAVVEKPYEVLDRIYREGRE